jgi:hypothetical protein
MKQRSHFTTCIATLVSLIHLSNWTMSGGKDEAVRQHIRLGIRLMKRFAEVWPIATIVLNQIKKVAREIPTTINESCVDC